MKWILVPLFLLQVCCALGAEADRPESGREVIVPLTDSRICVDGKLDEPCYQAPPLLNRFVVAGQSGKRAAETMVWLFWQRERLIFAFECEDANIVAAKPSSKKHDVDGQDRVEVFLWSGRAEDTYYCAEISAGGALHDYSARFYRRFDDAWTMPGLEYVALRTPKGYRVEGTLSRAGMEKMGFCLKPETHWRLGLFRADFPSAGSQPDWITWVDAKGHQPDFHLADSFGTCLLGREK